MNKQLMISFGMTLFAASLFAGPQKSDPVCAAFPDWQGIADKGRLWGRALTPSDLRHKITVVIEFDDAKKLQGLLPLTEGPLRMVSTPDHSVEWLIAEDLGRDATVVFSYFGTEKDHEAVTKALLGYKGEDKNISSAITSVRSASSGYERVTFPGAPDATGKRPYIYVMGPTGKEPLFQGELNAATIKSLKAAASKAKSAMHAEGANWEANYGMLPEESKYRAMIKKAIDKQKPLKPVADKILKDVTSKDAAVAAEAQMAYDAIIQGRSELENRIFLEYQKSPARAKYDMEVLFKLWPSEKKKFEKAVAFMKTIPEADQLYRMVSKVMAWSKPDFAPKNAGEAKKIVAELNKMKKMLEKLKEAKQVEVQNTAVMLDAQLDELIGTIPALVPSK